MSNAASAEKPFRNPVTGRAIGEKAMLVVLAVIIAVPALIVLISSLKTQGAIIKSPLSIPTKPSLEGYRSAKDINILRALRNSAWVVAFSVPFTALFAAMTAFAITRLGGWRSRALFILFSIGLAIPAQVIGVQQSALFIDLKLNNSFRGLILINVAATLPVSIFILTGFMRTLPKELFEAATIDGASPWRTFRSVAVPLSMPSIAAVSIFLFVMHWNDLFYPYLLISDNAKATLPVAISSFRGEFSTNYPGLFAGLAIASAPMVAAYVFAQRWFVAGLTSGAVKG
jgi:raffinose/stachyose/melibiose transport system permease protein